MTMSPSIFSPPSVFSPLPAGAAGNDNTLVALSILRHSRLRSRIAWSSVSTILTSPAVVESVSAAAAIASRTVFSAKGWPSHSGEATWMSTDGVARRRLKAGEQPYGFGQPRRLPVRQIDLARIAGHDHAAVLAQPGQEHLHLHRGGILRFVENDAGIRQRAAAHEGQRRDLDLAAFQCALDDAGIHQVVQCVIDRA